MFSLGRAGFAFTNLFKVPVALRPLCHSQAVSTARTRLSLSQRALSTTVDPRNDLFNYTSGRWVYNEVLRLQERRTVFDVDGLRQLAAESLNQSRADIVSLSKLAEGGFNRTFLITMRDGRQLVARIPYPMAIPKYYAVASEVATIEYMRSRGLPAPEIYGYSADADNVAGTAYILMEYAQGTKLTDIWQSLPDDEVVSVVRQLTELESRTMSLSFPAGGSLYFAKDLEKVGEVKGVPLEDDERFCVGPDTRVPLWYGRRAALDVDRGPYISAESTLVAGARKEVAYLTQFGQPMQPFRRERRDAYKFQPQFPSTHIENLQRYLSIAPALVPNDPALNRFCIRHPDLQYNNIIVSRSPESSCKVVGLIDWQHASILPMFLQAGIPQRLQNYTDPLWQSPAPPSLPADFDSLSEGRKYNEEYNYRRRLVHYHYITSTAECNPLHHAAFTDPLYTTRGRLFELGGAPWEGETFDLQSALMDVAEDWDTEMTSGTGGGVSPCPISFDAEDLREAAALSEALAPADRAFGVLQGMVGIGENGWVDNEDYEGAVAFLEEIRQKGLKGAESEEERQEFLNHWPWDDMDEEGCY